MVLLTVTLFLHCPGGFQLGCVGEQQFGLSLLPEPHKAKVHAGCTEGHYGTLFKTK